MDGDQCSKHQSKQRILLYKLVTVDTLRTSESSVKQLVCAGLFPLERKSHTLMVPLEFPVSISDCEMNITAFTVQLSASENQ